MSFNYTKLTFSNPDIIDIKVVTIATTYMII
ncbi:hypothetical protein METHPM2_400044 [Pseudomonas sp. PM2]